MNEDKSDLVAQGRMFVDRYNQEFGPVDPKTLQVKFKLGRALLLDGEYGEAKEVFSEVLTAQHAYLPENDEQILTSQWHLASALVILGEFKDSLRLLEHIIEIASFNGVDDLSFPLNKTLPDLARVLFLLGRYGEEVPVRRRILASLVSTRSLDDPKILEARINLAWALRGAGENQEALDLDGLNLEELDRYPENRAAILNLRYNRGIDLIKVGRTNEGEAEVVAAYELIMAELSPDDPLRRTVEPFGAQIKRYSKQAKSKRPRAPR
ncbi:MAG TPA: tetratricopeptide repeat protein [Acidimicrobiales bacterium]